MIWKILSSIIWLTADRKCRNWYDIFPAISGFVHADIRKSVGTGNESITCQRSMRAYRSFFHPRCNMFHVSAFDVERRVASRGIASRGSRIWTTGNRYRLTNARVKGREEGGGGARDWSWRFNGTDSQGKVSRSIVPALVSFINVIPVYEMRGALVFTWFPF